jgi:hypothetical protein
MSFTDFLSNALRPVAPQSEEEARKRYEEEQKAQEKIAAEEAAKPVTQTLKIDPKTGEQTLTVSGSPEDLSAANPLTPTVAQPEQPIAPALPAQTATPAPVAPVAAEQMPAQVATPPQGPVTPQAQAPREPMQQNGPIAPELPQPGPGVQVAGPAQVPPQVQQKVGEISAAAGPSPEQQYVDVLASNDKQKLARLYQDPNAPEYAKRAAADQLQFQFKQDTEKQKAEAAIQSAITSGNGSDFAKLLRNKGDEGSYVKAYLFQRLGLTDLAKQEQVKLGAESKWQPAIGKAGERALLQYDANGMPLVGYDDSGRRLSGDELASFAVNSSIAKGAVTGQTFGKAPIGGESHVISHTVLPNGAGVIWKDETTGQTLSAAPAGYAPVGQQNPVTQAAIRTASQVEAQMRKDNERAKQVGAPLYTEDDILREKEKVLNGALSTIGSGGEPVVPPTRANAAGIYNAAQGLNAVQIASNLGAPIISGARDKSKQQALWDESVKAGRTGFTATGNPIARPGTSLHETANAVDIDSAKLTPEQRQGLITSGLRQLPNDPNHWEMSPAAVAGAKPAPAPTKSIAQSILDYEVAPPTGPSTPQKIALQNEINRLAQEQGKVYDAGQFKIRSKTRQDFITGQQGKAVQSMNVAVDHLDTLQEAATALNNKDFRLFNQVANMYSNNTGSPAVTDFNGVKTIVGSEVAKAISGGATALGDREEIRAEISAANSPAQLSSLIHKYQKLLAGQVKGLKQTYEGAGLTDFDKKLLPRTKKVLNETEEPTRSKW